MTENPLPAAIAQFVDATNRGDTEAFVAAFTEDAYINDWGREFHGHDGVRSWNRTDNIGVRSHFDHVSAERGAAPDSYVVTVTVTGDGFNGTGTMNVELRDGRIASLRIS
jgi:ketosteroid isomerase-like protein